MKKSLTILALSILIWGCKKEDKPIEPLPSYEYSANGVKQYSVNGLSFASIDSATNDTLIYLFDEVNKDSKVEFRFNNKKIEAKVSYNDSIYYSDVVAFHYRSENGKLYGLFSFNAFKGFKLIQVEKGRFNDIKIN